VIYILSFRDLTAKSHSSQKEIIKISLIRAKLCELLAKRTGRPQPSSYMLIGMFSLIDTLLHRELEDIIKELPLIDEVGQALLGYENDYYSSPSGGRLKAAQSTISCRHHSIACK
jgi:c-di-GMP-related signal transduction protein